MERKTRRGIVCRLVEFSTVKRLQWVTNGKTRDTAKDEGTGRVKRSDEERNSLEISDTH